MYHSLAASVAGVDLLAGKTHGQQSERPRDYGSGGCGSQALSAPNANMVEPRQHGSETGHARHQDDGNEDGRHHVACIKRSVSKPAVTAFATRHVNGES